MGGMTFDEFKSYFEFSLEVVGVTGGLGTIFYKLDGFNSIYKVVRGRANSTDEEMALETLQQGGGAAQRAARQAARALGNSGHRNAAQRLEAIRQEARPASPGHVV